MEGTSDFLFDDVLECTISLVPVYTEFSEGEYCIF